MEIARIQREDRHTDPATSHFPTPPQACYGGASQLDLPLSANVVPTMSLTPPTWSWCQCVSMMVPMEACSWRSTPFRCSIYCGTFSSPVSIKIRLVYAKISNIINTFLSKFNLHFAHFLPLPSKYVLVPCNVIGLGLQPSILMIEEVRRVTGGISAIFVLCDL